jgi:DNA-directed RNA polymerase subunit H (RpoH/RPB5)
VDLSRLDRRTSEPICHPAAAAGSSKVGDAIFNEIFHPIAHRILERCDACLRIVRTAQLQGKQVFYRLEDVPGCG